MTTPRSPNCTPTSASPSLPTASPTSKSAPPETTIDAELAAQDAARRAKREARWARIRKVRNYLRTLDDPELRKVAYFLGKGFSDEAVAAAMRTNVAAVQEAKNRLRQGLVEAGAGPEA